MASLWEIADPSNLKYNSDLGYTQGDGYFGPPAGEGVAPGWVITGYTNNTSTVAGHGNCINYSASSIGMYGTIAALNSEWTTSTSDVGPWNFQVLACNLPARVWCIED